MEEAASKKKPHFHGHRERLRKRFLECQGEGMPDYEIVELLLMTALPQRDVKPLAKDLIERFDSLAGVLSAAPEELMTVPGIKETACAALKVVQTASIRLSRAVLMEKPIIGGWDRLIDYCRTAMGHDKVESFRILFLDRKNRLIADEAQQRGTVDHTPVYPREIVKRALDLGASALILVHNHPSGDVTPSKDDVDMTKRIREGAEKLGITLFDHVIVSKSGETSFKALGLL
ncbi:MAG: DNA repair protein RadC [Rhodospirillales bacterium]|nr:DNA repair protein RadC [Rhodospirillales bacterium]